MPPIFGILNTNLRPVDQHMIDRMKESAKYIRPRKTKSLEIRGCFMATSIYNEKAPISSDLAILHIRNLIIAADAVLYKRTALKKQLEIADTSDAEIILHAYIKWGIDCVKYLYGDFAFVIFNTDSGEVFAGRDHLGIRPLFYCKHDEYLIFSSELRILTSVMAEKLLIRKDYLLDTLVTVKTQKDLTPFDKLYRLKPGHSLTFYEGGICIKKYWEPDPYKNIQLKSEEEYIAFFQERLINAVEVRCSGNSIIGTELSGGLDSSAVTGIAVEMIKDTQRNLFSFSNISPKETYIKIKDEEEFISAMVEFKNLKWVGVDFHICKIMDLLKHTLKVQDCFIQQKFSIFNQSLLYLASENNVQVLLSGFGGDELVSAHNRIPWNELILKGKLKVIFDEIFHKGITFNTLLKPGIVLIKFLMSFFIKNILTNGIFTPKILDKRFANLPINENLSKKYNLRSRFIKKYQTLQIDFLSQRQCEQLMRNHLPQRMEYCYAMAAQYGIEYRYPLLDVDLIETALAFPAWFKYHNGVSRYLFREAIKGFVPEQIRLRNDKTGSTIPQTYYSLINECDELLELIKEGSRLPILNEIFDFSSFSSWFEKVVKRDLKDLNYLMHGAFFDYLMIILYYSEEDRHESLL